MVDPIPFPPTRWSLVGLAAGSDATAIVERYADCLLRYLRLRFPELPAADLDDLGQEVFTHLLERPDLLGRASPRDGGRFRYFLATIALNRARNIVRDRQRTRRRERPLGPEDGEADPADVDRAWEEAVLARSWNDLRGWAAAGDIENDIPLLLADHLAGEPLRDLAARQGLSLATCQRRIAKGRTWLRRAIEIHQQDD